MNKNSSDPYALLGLKKDASDRDIRVAFLRLVRKFHPDKNISEFKSDKGIIFDVDKENNENAFNIIVKYHALYEAYCILRDPEKRREYDLTEFNQLSSRKTSWHKTVKFNELDFCEEENLFCYYCRCGDIIVIDKHTIENGINLFFCDNCSTKIIITF